MNNLGYYNGKIGLIEEMSIPMTDRAFYFGDGVYEAVLCRNNIHLFFCYLYRINMIERSFHRLLNTIRDDIRIALFTKNIIAATAPMRRVRR